MRALVLPVLLAACTSTAPTEPVSMRDRLATETHLFVTTVDGAGAILELVLGADTPAR
jgi:hypothetical protein